MIRVQVAYSPRLSTGEKRLLTLPNRLRNLRPVMQRGIAPAFNRMELRHIRSKGAAFGRRWAPWAPSTLAARIRKGNAGKGLLNDTGRMFRTLLRARENDSRLKATPNGVSINFNIGDKKAIFHQVGTSRMPERQVIPDPLPRSFMAECRAILREFIATGKVVSA